MSPRLQTNSINDALPEETICLIIGQVDFRSKAAVLRVCKKWYRLLTYPPQGSGVWGVLPLNLMRLHVRVDSAQLEWLARRAAGVAGVSINATSPHELVPRLGPNQQLGNASNQAVPELERREGLPYRLTLARHFADMTLARILGMLSPWLPPASVLVNLRGATFEHRSFAVLTSEAQPWLTNALVDIQLKSNMVKVEDRFPQLCTFTNLTRLVCTCDPGSYARSPCLQAVPPAIGHLTRLHTLKLELHANSVGLPSSATALQALRKLEVWAGAKLQPLVLRSFPRLEDLGLFLGKRAPPGQPAQVDEEGLADAIAPLTRLTRLHLNDCGLGAIPAEVMGMRHLLDLDVSCNQLWRCGGPPPASDSRPAEGTGESAEPGAHPGPNPAPFPYLPHFIANFQQQLQQAAAGPAAQQEQQNAQHPGDGGAGPAAPAGEAAPGDDAGAGPSGIAQAHNDLDDSIHDSIHHLLQGAHAAQSHARREALDKMLKRQGGRPSEAAVAGDGWWPADLSDALRGLTHLSLSRNDIKALPPGLSRLTSLRELNLSENMLGKGGRVNPVPTLPKLVALNAAFNGYNVLPPGLLQLHSLTRLKFTDVPHRTLPSLDPLLQMQNLQQVILVRDPATCRHMGAREFSANMIQAGAFEAKFVAMRQARAGAQPAPPQRRAAEPGTATHSVFMQLGAVEGLYPNDDSRGSGGMYGVDGPVYADNFLLPGYMPPGHPYAPPHMHMFDPGDDDDEGGEDELDEDDEEDEMQWAEDNVWGGPGDPDFWHPPSPPQII